MEWENGILPQTGSSGCREQRSRRNCSWLYTGAVGSLLTNHFPLRIMESFRLEKPSETIESIISPSSANTSLSHGPKSQGQSRRI